MVREQKLAQFLQHAAGREFITWEFDCTYWLADWLMLATGGADPAKDYRDHTMARQAIGKLGFAVLVARTIRKYGLVPTLSPELGDIALLRNRPGCSVVGAIKTARGWAVLTPDKMSRKGVSLLLPAEAPSVRVMAAGGLPRG